MSCCSCRQCQSCPSTRRGGYWAREEISADVQMVRLVDVLGGPDFEVSYPNGDRTAYVTAVYEARIITGSPAPGDGELSLASSPGSRRDNYLACS